MTPAIRNCWQQPKPRANDVKRVHILALCLVASGFASSAFVMRKTYLLTPSVTEDTGWRRLLPAPPLNNSAADRADMDTVKFYQTQVDSPRWEQARADVSFDVFQAYGTLLGPDFTAAKNPQVAELIDYAQLQLSRASAASKAAFMRPRPYVTEPSLKLCGEDAPDNTSYPSGHAAWGWLSARIISDIYPSQLASLTARGKDYGLSRVVCGFHYPTDVVAGQEMGRIVYDGLQEDPTYKRLFARTQR
jgi:acid phosphatase (class A)